MLLTCLPAAEGLVVAGVAESAQISAPLGSDDAFLAWEWTLRISISIRAHIIIIILIIVASFVFDIFMNYIYSYELLNLLCADSVDDFAGLAVRLLYYFVVTGYSEGWDW